MKRKLNTILSAATAAALFASSVALPVFAQTVADVNAGVGVSATAAAGTSSMGVSADTSAKAAIHTSAVAKLIGTAQTRADQEITRRINALNALNARVSAMVRVSADDKASLSSEIQSQVSAMNNLQAQISSDAGANSTTSLKTDIQSITKSYRIFALVIPQGAIEAATDRVLDVAGMLTTLSTQLQTRITAAQSAGNDMSASVSALADMNAKIADANTQANAAVSETASLQPDNGDQTIMASNTAALKDAHTKIQAAQQDLVTARKDAGTIVQALTSLKVSAAASSTVTAGGSAQ